MQRVELEDKVTRATVSLALEARPTVIEVKYRVHFASSKRHTTVHPLSMLIPWKKHALLKQVLIGRKEGKKQSERGKALAAHAP